MDKILPIVTVPNPILYQKTQAVKDFGNGLQELVQKMIPTMRVKDGVGLAAPQVGFSQ
ncbi:peptide deformylase, partial [Patescibacteria group bacterium]|nr:peptide deformylase [Patescibacteria group bacterium]